MSLSFSVDFHVSLGSLDRSLEVTIIDDHMVLTSDFYHDCTLEIFDVGFPIDLIPIPMRDVCIIAGMDTVSVRWWRFKPLVGET